MKGGIAVDNLDTDKSNMIELGVPSRKFGKRRGSASNMLSGSFVKVEG